MKRLALLLVGIGACAAAGNPPGLPRHGADKERHVVPQLPVDAAELDAIAHWYLEGLRGFDGTPQGTPRFAFSELPQASQAAFQAVFQALSAATALADTGQDPLPPPLYRIGQNPYARDLGFSAFATEPDYDGAVLNDTWLLEMDRATEPFASKLRPAGTAERASYTASVHLGQMQERLQALSDYVSPTKTAPRYTTLELTELMVSSLFALNGCREVAKFKRIIEFLNTKARLLAPVDAWLPVTQDGQFASRWLGLRGLMIRTLGVVTRWTVDGGALSSPLGLFEHDLTFHEKRVILADASWALHDYAAGGLLDGQLERMRDRATPGALLMHPAWLSKNASTLPDELGTLHWKPAPMLIERLNARHVLWRTVLQEPRHWREAEFAWDGAFWDLHESANLHLLCGEIKGHKLECPLDWLDDAGLEERVALPQDLILVQGSALPDGKGTETRIARRYFGRSGLRTEEQLGIDAPLPTSSP